MKAPYPWAGSGPHRPTLAQRIAALFEKHWCWIASVALMVGMLKSAQIYSAIRGLFA